MLLTGGKSGNDQGRDRASYQPCVKRGLESERYSILNNHCQGVRHCSSIIPLIV